LFYRAVFLSLKKLRLNNLIDLAIQCCIKIIIITYSNYHPFKSSHSIRRLSMKLLTKSALSLALILSLTACGNDNKDSAIGNAIDATKDAATDAVEATTNAVDSAAEAVADAAEAAVEMVENAGEAVMDSADDMAGDMAGKADEAAVEADEAAVEADEAADEAAVEAAVDAVEE
jgi:hypothetical protein